VVWESSRESLAESTATEQREYSSGGGRLTTPRGRTANRRDSTRCPDASARQRLGLACSKRCVPVDPIRRSVWISSIIPPGKARNCSYRHALLPRSVESSPSASAASVAERVTHQTNSQCPNRFHRRRQILRPVPRRRYKWPATKGSDNVIEATPRPKRRRDESPNALVRTLASRVRTKRSRSNETCRPADINSSQYWTSISSSHQHEPLGDRESSNCARAIKIAPRPPFGFRTQQTQVVTPRRSHKSNAAGAWVANMSAP